MLRNRDTLYDNKTNTICTFMYVCTIMDFEVFMEHHIIKNDKSQMYSRAAFADNKYTPFSLHILLLNVLAAAISDITVFSYKSTAHIIYFTGKKYTNRH